MGYGKEESTDSEIFIVKPPEPPKEEPKVEPQKVE